MSFNEWKEVKLEDVVDTISKRHKFDKDKIILINTSDVLEGKVLNHEYVQNENLKGQFKKSFQKNDILYSEIRPQNKRFAYVDFQSDDYVASTKLMVLRKKNEMITSNFLYQILKSDDLINELQVIAESRSGTFPQITYNELSRMKIKLPPLDEQKAIAHILSTLDDKIEVNNQINKTLENMAQAIFKQWFVDFEFPNEEGEPYKSSGGEMFESELGMIPKGWEVKKSSDIANVNIGKTPPRKEKECFTLDPDDYKWISIKDLGNSGAYIFDSSEYLTKESIEKYNVKVVPDNTVVLSFKLTIGRVSITCGQMTTNEAIAHFNLSNKSKITTEYLYLYLKGFDYGKLGNTSSIANAVNSKIIKSMPIIVPDNKTIKTFSEVMESVFSKIKYTIKQIFKQ